MVHFPRPLDHALLNSFIQLVNESGIHVKGSIELENRETTWKFYPLERWQSGNYSLKINKRLEDIAGNNLFFANKFTALAVILLFPVMLNAFLAHLFLDPAGTLRDI